MQPIQWNTYHIKQCKKKTRQAMLSDEHSLVLFSEDFGKLTHSKPAAVCVPQTINDLQELIHYAHEHESMWAIIDG
jgi:hypothetical protein